VATKHDDSVKGGEFPELTKAVREKDSFAVAPLILEIASLRGRWNIPKSKE
jgi:hypothetical protein